jgi:hypothetical protein
MAFADVLVSYTDWRTISIAAAALSVVAAAMLIMLSRLFGLRNLEQVAKTEFVYAASTVLIVMMVVGIIQVAEPRLADSGNSLSRCLYLASFGLQCNVPANILGTNGQPINTLIDWMKLYMASPTQCVQRFMQVLYWLEVPIAAGTSIYMELFMSEHASGFGLKWIEERIMNAVQSLTFYMYMFYLMVHVLNFIKAYAGFFFSIGVALRAFPPTRGTGAYLMAISFGLYFVFPLAYITIATFSLPHVQSNLVTFNATAYGSGGLAYACSLPDVPDVRQFACGAANYERPLEMLNRIRSNSDALSTMVRLQLPDFERHIAHSICIFPMLAFVVLLTFVLNMTNLFGGNIPEIGRGLVKLI